MNSNEEIPYRAPMTAPDPNDNVSVQDENDYSTLRHLKKELKSEIDRLKSVEAFDLTEGKITIKEQIAAHQLAVDILENALQMVTTAVSDINAKSRKVSNG